MAMSIKLCELLMSLLKMLYLYISVLVIHRMGTSIPSNYKQSRWMNVFSVLSLLESTVDGEILKFYSKTPKY